MLRKLYRKSALSPWCKTLHYFSLYLFGIAGDQVLHRIATQKNVLCQWANLKDSQNTFRHRYVVQGGRKVSRSLSRSTVDLHHFVYIVQCRRLTTVKCISSRPMECNLTTLMIDGSNVSTSHRYLNFVACLRVSRGLRKQVRKLHSLDTCPSLWHFYS